jgi:hypothetical protein
MKRLLPFLVLLFILGSCHMITGKKVHGDGKITSQAHTVTDFSSVDVSGAIDVILTEDSVASVKVETDANLQEYIDIYVEGNTLHIHPEEHTNLDPTKSIKVYVTAAGYNRLEASGACSFQSQTKITSKDVISIDMTGASTANLDIKAPRTEIDVSGACSVTIKGETKDFSIDGSGSTNIKAFELMAENTNVDMSGAGNAEVFASVKLGASLSGAADVVYKGEGAVIANTSGASSVRKAN